MAVEVRELVIKTTIDNSAEGSTAPGKDQDNTNAQMVIKECVEQVMDLLNRQKER